MSLSSSLYEHIEENGRTYHRYKEGSEFYHPWQTGGGKSAGGMNRILESVR